MRQLALEDRTAVARYRREFRGYVALTVTTQATSLPAGVSEKKEWAGAYAPAHSFFSETPDCEGFNLSSYKHFSIPEETCVKKSDLLV